MDSRPITQAELDQRERLIAAELLAAADERAEQRIVAAVESVVTNVSLQVGMAEKTTTAKIDGLRTATRSWIIAGLVGGQTFAAVASAYMTGNGARVESAAVALLPFL